MVVINRPVSITERKVVLTWRLEKTAVFLNQTPVSDPEKKGRTLVRIITGTFSLVATSMIPRVCGEAEIPSLRRVVNSGLDIPPITI